MVVGVITTSSASSTGQCGGICQLLRGKRIGQAGQRVRTGGEAGLGEDLVDDEQCW
jgi:hypothetical protein